MFLKNTASQKAYFYAYTPADGLPKTGDAAQLTAYVAKDWGAATVLADTSATEVDATNAPGMYVFDLAQGETNAEVLMFSGKSSTGGVKVIGAPAVVHTVPATGILSPATLGRTLVVDAAGLADANAVKVGPSGSGTAQTARDIGATLGVAGAGLTALGDTRLANLDAAVSTRLATAGYTAPLDAAGTRSAVGLAAANLDTQLAAIDDLIDTEVAAIFNRIGAPAGASMAADVAAVAALVAASAIRAALGMASANLDTQLGDLPTAAENTAAVWAAASRTLTANTNLNDPTAAAIAAAVVAETMTELSAIPSASPTLKQALAFLYMALRNKVDVTATTKEIHTDAGTVLGTKALTDDGSTYSEAKMA